ncbi:MAG: OmpA family protein, partial [Bacteroidota bacterium]|nr:OmpA family protein [Bacteroidota bacterium]
DNEGDEAHNMTLSKNRANSVKNYMVSRGISSYRITTNGFGAKQPVSENDSDEGRQENRRVEIKFVE